MTSTTLVIIAMAAVVIALVAGLGNLMRSNPSASLSQTLMRWRVGLQFIAIAVAMLVLWLLK